MRVRRRIRVEGVVQGVGFRPFVYTLASRLALAGSVMNDAVGVRIEVEGEDGAVGDFIAALRQDAPPLAVVERTVAEPLPVRGDRRFVILASEPAASHTALVAPDVATCALCVAEILDPRDRRYRYAFTNCTQCGPRFTIARDVPYDRSTTTMAQFAMCEACATEYRDPRNRRFHAEPIACPACGPRLALVGGDGRHRDGDVLARAAEAIRRGAIVALKGLGGYHLAALAADEQAVATLRTRKHREDRPFATMVADTHQARTLIELDAEAECLLTSAARPIVVAPRTPAAPVAASVAPHVGTLGVMLPYTPLHHLLLREVGQPIVLTSGNVSDEPIAYEDDEARSRLAGIADLFVVHDRRIHVRTDDSVVRALGGRALPLRRSRGYAPRPVSLAWPLRRAVLACGGELKNTICLAKDRRAFVSHHLGDLENAATFRAFTDAVTHYRRLFDIQPEILAHDLHPEYLSTKWARAHAGVRLIGVQHHHAHIAACLAEHGERGPVIGVAFDGLGYGSDGTLWGGEFLVADVAAFTRAGHLTAMPLPGGAAAIREPWRMAAVYLDAIFGSALPALDVRRRNADRWRAVLDVARVPALAPLTSSVGRLLDAIAALLGVRDTVTYEGQAAVELEQLADPLETDAYCIAPTVSGATFTLAGADLMPAAVADLRAGRPAATIAARVHHGLAATIAQACDMMREAHGLTTVALSGGVFQNALLLEDAVGRLTAAGFRVLHHREVPPNDGGLSLGQAVVAAMSA